MPRPATTITEFRAQMQASIGRFYRTRGLPGRALYRYADRLQQLADELQASGHRTDSLNKILGAEQSRLLRFSDEYSPYPEIDQHAVRSTFWSSSFYEGNLSPSKKMFVDSLGRSALEKLFRGRIGFQLNYAGYGSRLELKQPKFTITPRELLASLQHFVSRADHPLQPVLQRQLAEKGGLAATLERFASLREWSLGERIFLLKAFSIFTAAKEAGLSEAAIQAVFPQIKFKLVLSARSGPQIVEQLAANDFFRFAPANCLIMFQPEHPTFSVEEDGSLRPDDQRLAQGNHGLTVFHANLDRQWFRLLPGSYQEEQLARTDYREFQAGLDLLLVESVEDTTQLRRPFDLGFIGSGQRAEPGSLVMQIVRQKSDNPQNGGFLCRRKQRPRRTVVLESNRLPGFDPRKAVLISRGWSGINGPNLFEDLVLKSRMIDDLHPTFKVNGDGRTVRIEPEVPFGDANLYPGVPSSFFYLDRQIENLKDPVDIIPALEKMAEMERDHEVVAFARNFLRLR